MNVTGKRILRLFLFIAGYVGFLVAGAVLFATIEGPEERRLVEEVRTARMGFLKDHNCVDGEFRTNWYHTTCSQDHKRIFITGKSIYLDGKWK